MTSPAVQLYERLSEALGAHDVHPEQRRVIQQAYTEAGVHTATWDDLSQEVRELVIEIEQRQRQAWDDPADVPAQLD